MQISSAVALVTGANRGIGRSIVDRLLADGVAHIYAGARTRAAAEILSGLDPRVTGLVLDVTSDEQVREAAARAIGVTLLINNAGVLDPGHFLEADRAQLERAFATNFYGSLAMSTAFAPVIAANGGGTIVNVLTITALATMPSRSAYNASKAAAWSMTQSLRATLADKRIRVVGVFPGPVDTEMLAGLPIPKTPPADVAAAIVAGIAADLEDIYPDPAAQGAYAQWKLDHKSIERQFASL
jgi:NAD(P)-dependent dehydrogenase (short-subunit alcohol dehydrogenase family)